MLGGSAVHFALAASFFTDVRVVGPVGDDFGDEQLAVLAERGIDADDIEHVAGGETFFWRGHYDHDMNVAHTDDTQLNVFADFEPKLSPESCESQMLFLGNIQPELQRDVRAPVVGRLRRARLDEPVDRHRARLARGRDRRGRLPAAQRRRAADAHRASRTWSRRRGATMELGPSVVVAKRGEYGAVLFTADEASSRSPACRSRTSATRPAPATASPAASSATSTRSGAERRARRPARCARAMAYGSVMASFNVEDFGTDRVRRAERRRDRRAPGRVQAADPLRGGRSPPSRPG